MVALSAELRAYERQAAEELDQWKVPAERPTTVIVTVEAYALAQLCTKEQFIEMRRKALDLERGKQG